MPVIAHLSDIHLGQDRPGPDGPDGGARAEARAARVMAHLEALPGPIDAVLVTGDIADHGSAEEYRTAARVLASDRWPVLTCPGNHDDRATYRTALLGEEPSAAPVNRLHELPGLTVLMCDSSVPGRNEGRFDEETLGWLDTTLSHARRDVPAVVAFHHPPVELHVPVVDPIRLLDEERLAAVLRCHPQVAAVLCGHAHTPAATRFAGLPLAVAPGVVSTALLPFESGEELAFDHPPMVSFHILDAQRRLTTHHRIVLS
ncbi:metallophosphoesterase [Streptomyces sp. NRRL B-24484]|uniref:metallophosphoesterase n=1 Tax=Streptomyces sp. NRRL B-24484 TaxID=1463833 RepID=UPI0004BF9802|nr:metallophosphoesterase [Streptomyces sp. NRRL B-24484]